MEETIKMATQILLVLVPLAGLTFFIEEQLYRTLIREDGWIDGYTVQCSGQATTHFERLTTRWVRGGFSSCGSGGLGGPEIQRNI